MIRDCNGENPMIAMRYCAGIILSVLLSARADAQSVEDIKKALISPPPIYRGLTDQRGVTIVQPNNPTPPTIDLHIPF
jgi:hypothetical protein